MAQRDLEIDEDIAHQRFVWRLERVSWVLLTLTVISALLGLLGHGPLSAREVALPDSQLLVRYNRFERHLAQTELSLELLEASSDETSVRIGQDFLGSVEIMGFEPEPERVELDEGFMTYVFNTNGPGKILLDYKPMKPGALELEVGVGDEPLQSLPLFVFP